MRALMWGGPRDGEEFSVPDGQDILLFLGIAASPRELLALAEHVSPPVIPMIEYAYHRGTTVGDVARFDFAGERARG